MAKEYTSSMNLQEVPLDLHRCKAATPDYTGNNFFQCRRKAKANGWCWQHDPEREREKRAYAEELRAYKAQLAESATRTETATVLRRQLADADGRLAEIRDLTTELISAVKAGQGMPLRGTLDRILELSKAKGGANAK